MNEEEFLLLKSIALSLERIADSLEKNAHNEVDDKVDVAVESSDDTNENENMDYGCSVKEIDVNILATLIKIFITYQMLLPKTHFI